MMFRQLHHRFRGRRLRVAARVDWNGQHAYRRCREVLLDFRGTGRWNFHPDRWHPKAARASALSGEAFGMDRFWFRSDDYGARD